MEKFTNRIIQYEDNIFYLKLILNNIKKSELISINFELFQKNIKDTLLFINKTSQILYDHLQNNDKLITKDEQIHSILNLKIAYIKECRRLINEEVIKLKDFDDIISNNEKEINYISKIIENKNNNEYNKEDLTTNEELNILFVGNYSTNKD